MSVVLTSSTLTDSIKQFTRARMQAAMYPPETLPSVLLAPHDPTQEPRENIGLKPVRGLSDLVNVFSYPPHHRAREELLAAEFDRYTLVVRSDSNFTKGWIQGSIRNVPIGYVVGVMLATRTLFSHGYRYYSRHHASCDAFVRRTTEEDAPRTRKDWRALYDKIIRYADDLCDGDPPYHQLDDY